MGGDPNPGAQTDGFDLMLQFAEEVVNDLACRQLGDHLSPDRHPPAFLPRNILKNESESQLSYMLEWGFPRLAFEGDLLATEVLLSGSVRSPALNQNLSITASAKVQTPVQMASDDAGAPYVVAASGSDEALELDDVRLDYVQAEAPKPSSIIDPGTVAGLLSPSLAPALLDRLTQVRLSYALESLPIRLSRPTEHWTHQREQPELVFAASEASARLISGREGKALALGVALAGGRMGNSTRMSLAIPKTPASNIALILSNAGMNRLFAQLEAAGRLCGVASLPASGQPVAWAWEGLTCAFEEGIAAVAGRFTAGALVDDVRLLLTCSLDQRRELKLTPVGGLLNPVLNNLATEAFHTLLERLFRTAGAHAGEPGMWQRFIVPHTHVKVEAPAVAMIFGAGKLTLLYQVPLPALL